MATIDDERRHMQWLVMLGWKKAEHSGQNQVKL